MKTATLSAATSAIARPFAREQPSERLPGAAGITFTYLGTRNQQAGMQMGDGKASANVRGRRDHGRKRPGQGYAPAWG